LRGLAPGKRALAFHEVPDVQAFRDLLDRLVDEWDFLRVEDWLGAPLGERGQLTLTFDDGYASWAGPVAEVLVERDLPALFFVCSGLVGLKGQQGRDFAVQRMLRTQELEFISLAQLRELAAHQQFEIGGHTKSHADLGPIRDRRSAQAEIAEGKDQLEEWLAEPVRWFAYPFGTPANVSPLARSVVEEAGMSAAFTLVPGRWQPDRGDRYLIGRDGLDPALPFAVSRAWLQGGYDRLYALKASAGLAAVDRKRAWADGPRSGPRI
jgi:peptidoglycan/xylan/chitin deacetylase (PgdA/CDA1 family)